MAFISGMGPIPPEPGAGAQGPNYPLRNRNAYLRYYAPVPASRPGQRSYRYYDTQTGEEISQYAYRKYLAQLQADERAQYDAAIRQRQSRNRGRVQDLYASYLDQQAYTNSQVVYDDFQALQVRLRYYNYQDSQLKRQLNAAVLAGDRAEQIRIQQQIDTLLSPSGDYARTLVALGRRPEDADWMVGMSGEEGGVHIQGGVGKVFGVWNPNSYVPGTRFYQQ